MNTITIEGKVYEVLQRQTADDMDAAGLPNLANLLRERGAVADWGLKRPKGGKLYYAREWNVNGQTVIRLLNKKGF